MNKDYFEKGDMYLDMYDAYGRNPIVFESAIKNYKNPRLASDDDLKLANKYAPRLFVNPEEFFDLKDLAAVIHPKRPIIAYNLFWGDDIDHPGDNDPSDHEVVWIEFDQNNGKVTGVYTYFHRAILSTEEAVKDANLGWTWLFTPGMGEAKTGSCVRKNWPKT